MEYRRPCGWKRYALKVSDKYPDIEWLGSQGNTKNDSEWAASYHWTKIYCAEPIAKDGLKPGNNNQFGIGVYCTPNIETAEKYAEIFTSPMTKKNIKLCFKIELNLVQLFDVKKKEDQMIIGILLMEKI